VDVNEAPDPGEPPPPPTPECASADTARVRFFHGAEGTPEEKEPGKPARTPNVVVFGTNTTTAVKERTLVSFQFGRAAIARLCPGTYDLRIALDDKAKTPLATVTPFSVVKGQKFTIVATGKANAADFRVVPLLEAFQSLDAMSGVRKDGKAGLVLVQASADIPLVDIDIDPKAAGSNVVGLAAFKASTELTLEGNTEKLPVELLVGDTTKASFTISRVPANVSLFGIVFGTDTEDTSRAMFLTGDDPLFGNTTRGGITISGS
jgi:hypothetical protein